ncbi:class I lanthipeptide [Hymenobacter persicinus]|uniref:class I lanthipeptide n=1 Tax=Hymenobacter persicinus TaxID=2025506 RepID=UPI0013EC3CAB|nr:class I lanthipeptide [Hymenobacter persicinus]
MKKVNTKITLNKQTLASLDQQQMATAKGGFTYSLSLGIACRYSEQVEQATTGAVKIDHASECILS